jgi:hypothetical protein
VRGGRWPAAAGLAVAAVVAAQLNGALVGVFFDDGVYLALARSLAEGHGYHLLYLPGAPGAVHYPFLYPLFLAALWRLGPAFPASLPLLKLSNAVLLGLFAALLVAYLRPRVGLGRRTWPLALVVVAAATALPLVTVATVLFAEPLFLVLAVAACWAADAARSAPVRARAWAWAAAAGALAGAAALTRSLGVAFVAGIAASLLLVRRPRTAAISAAVAAACLAPWLLWVARHHADVDPVLIANYGTYGDLVAQAGWTWLSVASLGDLLRPLGAVALAPFGGWLRVLLGVPALAVLVLGCGRLTRRAPALGWSLIAYLAIVAAWPYGPDRFLWAAWPLLAVAFAVGAVALWERAAGAARRTAVAARLLLGLAVGAVVVGYGFYQVRGYARGDVARLQLGISATLEEVLPWIRQATAPGGVVAGEDEALLWLYTGRRAVPNYLWRYRGRGGVSLGPVALHDWLLRSEATHVILTGSGSDAAATIAEVLGRYPGFLRLVRVWPGSVLAFAVAREEAAASAERSP